MSRRLLRAACLAAVLVAAGPAHANPGPEDPPTGTTSTGTGTGTGTGTERPSGTTEPAEAETTETTEDKETLETTTDTGTTGTTGTTGSTAPTGATGTTGSTATTAPTGTTGTTGSTGSTATTAATPGQGVGALLTRFQTLYRQAEEATEAYNATDVALQARQAEERRLGSALGKTRTALDAERAAAGRMAREQYRGARAGLSPYARMLLTGDAQAAQDQRHLAAREGARRAGILARLARGEHEADALATAARKALDAQRSLTAQRKQRKDEVTLRLREVERMLSSLTPEQLAQLGAREAAQTATAQRELIAAGALGSPATPRTPTAAGGAALSYAAAQIGKPYAWGAEGPGAFDCSGLTSKAWAHAGRSIPRTSQEQWAQLPKVPLDQLRPGDLVVYFPTATHVALYIGDGKVVQAPRPGAKVKVSPIAANPLLGAVRPDPGGTPLTAYTPPPLPEGAEAGDDTGYSGEAAPSAAAGAAPSTAAEAAEEAEEAEAAAETSAR
ncbi:NlpC/P60 family protein [Streptomyces sp. NPDC044571]|uniref:C40 family peptidase n=1 Tax=Streptomyces sp. NPDC044571 TaxID=3155371 RepID=UPI0033CBB926